ncbi:MAG: aminotransferase class V-fold PLP-dependent enzyme, partial [Streptococcus sp.]|nr:aminotransferase class V-fold PLP-dependent enzyme [Streptococcus sp.]
HKFHGPKGVGILYSTPQHFDNLLHGGEQEEKRRASTENMIGIAGMAKALSDAVANKDANYKHVQELRQAFLDAISGLDYYINGSQNKMPHVLNIGFPNQNNGILLTRLDLAGIAVSTGSACTAGTVDPSHVLASLYGEDSPRLAESIRVSFSELNTIEEVQELAKKLIEIVGK